MTTKKTNKTSTPNYFSYAAFLALISLTVFVALVTFSSAQATLDHLLVGLAMATSAVTAAALSLHFKD